MPKKLFISPMDRKSFVLFSSNFFANLSFFSMLAILTLYFTNSCGFSLKFSGIFMFFVLVFSRVGRIILLPLLKHYASKTALIISALLMSIGYFIIALSKIKIVMLLAFFAMGLGYGCNSVYVRSLIGTANNTNKLLYVQLSIVTNLSAAIGSLLAVCVFTHVGGEYVFLYSALMMLISAFIIYSKLHLEEYPISNVNMLQAIGFILRKPGVFWIFILTILSWIMYVQIFSVLPLLLNRQLGATQFLGSLYATNTAMITLFSMSINKYLLKFQMDAYQFIISGFIFIGAGFLLLYLMPIIATAYLSMVLWTLGEILIIPSLSSSLSELTRGSERLNVFAFNGVAIGLGEGVGMYLGTTLVELQPALQTSRVYLFLSLMTLIFLGVLMIFKTGHLFKAELTESIKI